MCPISWNHYYKIVGFSLVPEFKGYTNEVILRARAAHINFRWGAMHFGKSVWYIRPDSGRETKNFSNFLNIRTSENVKLSTCWNFQSLGTCNFLALSELWRLTGTLESMELWNYWNIQKLGNNENFWFKLGLGLDFWRTSDNLEIGKSLWTWPSLNKLLNWSCLWSFSVLPK